jgi:streptogramin lyase
VLALDPHTKQVSKRIPGVIGVSSINSGARISVIAAGEEGIWAPDGANIARIDPNTGAINSISIRFASIVYDISVGQGAVWVADDTQSVARIDPATDRLDDEVPVKSSLPGFSSHVLAIPGSVWVSDVGGYLARIDPGRDKAGQPAHIAGSIDALAYGEGALWVMDKLDGLILKLDPITGKEIDRFHERGQLDAFSVAFGSIWVVDSNGGTVTQLDPDTGHQIGSVIAVGKRPTSIAAGFGAVWVTNQGDGTLTKIEPVAQTTTTIQVGAPVGAVVADRESHQLWLVAFAPASQG